jgi:hypothetical protein
MTFEGLPFWLCWSARVGWGVELAASVGAGSESSAASLQPLKIKSSRAIIRPVVFFIIKLLPLSQLIAK